MGESHFTALSLFSSGGIGDLALRAAGFEILASNELLEERHSVFQYNFPETRTITGDVWERLDEIEAAACERLKGRSLTLFYATPPCQGMSKNGRGKLLNAVRAGRKPPMDERNRLIIPTIKLAKRLWPEILLLENVPEMANTTIVDESGELVPILGFMERELGAEYYGRAETVEFADYGVPQRRQRLITVFSRSKELKLWLDRWGTLMPAPTHSQGGLNGTQKWVTVRDAIADLPPLDAGSRLSARSSIPFHRVPLLDETKYWWVANTPPQKSAFDNQCDACGFNGNPVHRAKRDYCGVNRASRETPLHCSKCGALLPRPHVRENGEFILMKGYASAYKRMSFDKPASALTRNFSYACSDNKLHPTQNRTLSLHEAFLLHTLSQFSYQWQRRDGRKVCDKTIREIIGESIPPAGLKRIVDHLVSVLRSKGESIGIPKSMKADECKAIFSLLAC